MFNRKIPLATPWLVQGASGTIMAYRPIYRAKLWGLVPRVGLQIVSPTSDSQDSLTDNSTQREP